MHQINVGSLLQLATQLVLIIVLTSTAGYWLRRIRQPVITGELLVGIILGPTLLCRFFPALYNRLFPPSLSVWDMMSWVVFAGGFLLMTGAGFEANLNTAWKRRGRIALLWVTGVTVPFIGAFALIHMVPQTIFSFGVQRLTGAITVSLIMSMSALPVTIRILRDLDLLHTEAGGLIVSSLTLKNLTCWLLFIIVSTHASIVSGADTTRPTDIPTAKLAIALFLMALSFQLFRMRIKKVNRYFFVLLFSLGFGIFLTTFGIAPVIGFFAGGIIAKVFVGPDVMLPHRSILMLQKMVIPVYFVNIGLSNDFALSFNGILVACVTVTGVGLRFFGAYCAVVLSTMSKKERLLVAAAYMPGGMMQTVMAVAAYEAGMITAAIFSALMFGAIISSCISGPFIAHVNRGRAGNAGWVCTSVDQEMKVTPK